MKKFLSLMLTLALIITTLALPITASAADISLQGVATGSITVSYTPSASTVHPGETFTIGVKATPSEDITLDSYVVDIKYDGTQFTLNNEVTDDLKKFDSDTTNAYVRLISEANQAVTASAGLDLVTLNFTVKTTAVPSPYTTCILGDDTAFNVKNGNTIDWFVLGSNITDTQVTTTVAENTYSVKIDGNELVPGKTYYKTSGVTVSVTGTGIESVKVNEESLTAGGDGAYTKELTVGSEYTVKVKVIGKEEESKSFTLNTETIAAKLITDFAANELGYKKGDNFSVPVKITGLGTSAQAAMVSFKVEAASLTLDTTALGEGVTYDAENKTVMYGNTTGETGLGNDALVATLKFNVEDAAVYGVNSVTISEAKLALVKDIDPTADSIGNEINTQKVVVVPTATFGALPADITTAAWTNNNYTVAVTPADAAVSVKYLAVGELTSVETTTQSGLKAIYDNAQAVAAATVTVDSENNYVIVARVGDDPAVYQHVGTLTPGTNAWYDKTAPTVDITGIAAVTGVKNSKGGYVFDITGLAKSDARSGLDKIEYSLNGVEYTVFGLDVTSITIPEQNFSGNVTFKVTDKAGNTAVSDGFALKLDMDDPTVTGMAVGAVQADGSKDITANVADVGSGVTGGAITVAVYKGEAGSAALSDISAIETLEKVADAALNEGVATYKTTTAGRYYFVAADAAEHKAFASVDVAFETLSEASGIKVKVYASAADYAAGFKKTDDSALADFGGTNGSFRYVAIKADAAVTGYSNSLTLAKDGAEATAYTEETPITEAGNYVLTVTTTHGVNAADTKSATYKFSIVVESDMPSPNGDKRFNIIDFAMVRQLVELGKALPTAENGFSGGIFSGDVTGDLTVNGDDYADIIRSVRAGEKPGAYTFNVFNK